ncbi:glycosyltransferase [Arthrobacter sp. HS15c]|uniref:DNA glycosylase AlkZ-like family protein n=1 Tax=Arthrobacter sp. HS15c TaxID=3230279 RepID=UPI003466E8C9
MHIRLLVPGNIRHNSGGNVYNARLAAGLRALGVDVEVLAVDGSWPDASAKERRRLGGLLGAWEPEMETTPGTVTVVDGLIACGAPDELEYAAAAGQCTWVLLHMPSPSHPGGESRALHAAAGVICTSSSAAGAVKEKHGFASSRVALPGTEPGPVAAGSDPPHIIAVAALLPNKDQLLTVAALANLRNLAWTASLVGTDDADPAYAAQVRAAVSSLGMENRVRLTGQLDGRELEDEWSRADLSLLVSRAETFGLVVTESLARGIPVIVRKGTGAVEALGLSGGQAVRTDGDSATPGPAVGLPGAAVGLPGPAVGLPGAAVGLEVPENGEADVLAAVIRQWLSEPPLRARWRAAALDARDRLPRWDHTARTVLDILGGTAEGKPTAAGITGAQWGMTTHASSAVGLSPQAPEPQLLTPELLRAWAWHKQGLDGTLQGADPADVFTTAGWARSVGGANPYLTLFARAGTSRAEADAAVVSLKIHELPTARGCTYVLGHEDFAWGLQIGRDAAVAPFRVLARMGVERGEITLLEEEILHALCDAGGPLDPKQLKDLLGDSVRNLGEEGKRKGAATTLPTALGLLQADGRIRRVPVNGRLDQQRYAYTLWGLPPTAMDHDAARSLLLERYLGWTGGATVKQSQWFTGFTLAHTKAGLAAVGAVEVPAANGEVLWMLPDDVERLAAFEAPAGEQIQLLAGTDSLVLLRRNSADMFAEQDRDRNVLGSTLALQADLPDHPILDRGRIIGLWQYDPSKARIAHWLFDGPTPAASRRIAEVEAWIRDQLGDFRSFSLDSPASRQDRIDALDAAGQGS